MTSRRGRQPVARAHRNRQSGPVGFLLAEADGNRTRQRPNRPLTGFEDRGTHQASRRLLDGCVMTKI